MAKEKDGKKKSAKEKKADKLIKRLGKESKQSDI